LTDLWCSRSSASLVGIADQLGDSLVGVVRLRLSPAFSIVGSTQWNKRRSKTFRRLAKWTWRSSGLYFFFLLSLFVPFCNIIKCALKDSSCDSPISTNLMLTILASNASSSSTIVFKCPHTKNNSIFTQKVSQFKPFELDAMLTLTKKNITHNFTHSSLKIKNVFPRLVMGLSA
ncbi:hypothetical protein H5410_002118, partial [Solanum commersonii]